MDLSKERKGLKMLKAYKFYYSPIYSHTNYIKTFYALTLTSAKEKARELLTAKSAFIGTLIAPNGKVYDIY